MNNGYGWTGPNAMKAEIDELRSLLGCALTEHDGNNGQFVEGFMPHHWTHQARRLLTSQERGDG